MKNTQETPSPPRLIPALIAGFDAITKHVSLILFPIGLDLVLWFAPHVRIKGILTAFISDLRSAGMASGSGPEIQDFWIASREIWSQMAEQINLLASLRSYPVGIPSLMASILPVKTPLGSPVMVEISSFALSLGFLLVLLLVGLGLGSLYFSLVAEVSITEKPHWKETFMGWPNVYLRVLLLTLIWLLLLGGLSVPASCFISFATLLSGASLGQIAFLFYGAFMVWVIFPILFSPHGIFVKQYKVWQSIKRGIRITNATLPTTGLFILVALLLSQGLDILWKVTPEESWLTLIGVTGHAFIATGLLAASFVYYRDADRWVESLAKQLVNSSSTDSVV